MTYSTFIGKWEDEFVSVVVATVYTPSGSVVLQDSFGPGIEAGRSGIISLPPGLYRVTLRADGFIFPMLVPITVPEVSDETDPGGTFDNPIVWEFSGQPSVPAGAGLPCRVFGWVEVGSLSSVTGKHRAGMGVPVDTGPGTRVTNVARLVTFEYCAAGLGGTRQIRPMSRSSVAYDRHGYFEADLRPEAVYRVFLPDQGPFFVRTPESGSSANVADLAEAMQDTPLHEVV